VRFRLVLREFEQVKRPLDVDLVRRHGRELGARGEQRRQVEDQVHLELRHQTLEQRQVRDRPGDLAIDLPRDRVVEPRDVDGDNPPIAAFREPIDEAMADFAAGPGNDHDGFAHQPRSALKSISSAGTRDARMEAAVATRHRAAPTK
jgi:hypothetical protein